MGEEDVNFLSQQRRKLGQTELLATLNGNVVARKLQPK